jgi:hypothetical protein
VAVWQLKQASHFWFYAVNREAYPVTISVRLTGDGAVNEEPSGAAVPVTGGTASVTLQPLQLRVFEAPAACGIASVSTGIPDAELKRVKAQVDWLGKLNDAVVAGTLGASLSSGQKNALADAAADARREIAVKHVWQADMRLRHHLLLPIYRQLGQEPPGTGSDSTTASGIAPVAKMAGAVGVPVAKMVGGAVVVVSALGGIGIRRALTLANRKKP